MSGAVVDAGPGEGGERLLPGDPAAVGIVVQDMLRWLERAVIGLNLCPFAKAVHVRGQIHHAVSAARDHEALLADLERELDALCACDPADRDTTLLMAPWCLENFLDFNDFLAEADALLVRKGLDGEIQVASFHPRYQFAGTAAEDIGNHSNRAPYPTLHLLREASIDRAVAAFPDPEDIFGRNLQTLQALGAEGWQALGVEGRLPQPAPASTRAAPPRRVKGLRR